MDQPRHSVTSACLWRHHGSGRSSWTWAPRRRVGTFCSSQVPFCLAYSRRLSHMDGMIIFLKRPGGKLVALTSNGNGTCTVSLGQRLFCYLRGVTHRRGGASRSPGLVSSPPERAGMGAGMGAGVGARRAGRRCCMSSGPCLRQRINT